MNMLELIKPLTRIEIADLIATAFPPTRPPRSEAYRLGVEKALETASSGTMLPDLYEAGTVAYDAFHAGADEGRAIWARHIATKANLPHRQLAPANAPDLLAAELIHASAIITSFVAHVTPEQLGSVRAELELAGVIRKTGTISRAVERTAVLVQTGFLFKPEHNSPVLTKSAIATQ
ncbi:hypothetical protein GTP45_01220 [Pseudoduganella sp. FT55W]|uniref:Uncharacterized protein n=1 Tax=Duganella rivi TaxID=2666083 RepID=A0A7X4KAN1_9BURK|nr:hypothetical protein [Duganella rivi]MYM65453.1 hypothetical protein [Duganella rivi]